MVDRYKVVRRSSDRFELYGKARVFGWDYLRTYTSFNDAKQAAKRVSTPDTPTLKLVGDYEPDELTDYSAYGTSPPGFGVHYGDGATGPMGVPPYLVGATGVVSQPQPRPKYRVPIEKFNSINKSRQNRGYKPLTRDELEEHYRTYSGNNFTAAAVLLGAGAVLFPNDGAQAAQPAESPIDPGGGSFGGGGAATSYDSSPSPSGSGSASSDSGGSSSGGGE